jgi:nitrate/nitrite-specific signal transduction histidine kinase
MNVDLSRRRICTGALALFGLFGGVGAGGAASAALALPSAINKSGRQRMLSQRLGKAWAMQALAVEPELAAKIRQQSQALFISQLEELQKTTPTLAIATAVAALAQAWDGYQRDLALTPGKDNAARVYQGGDQTLQRAQELTALYEKQLGTPQGHLVNIAGRQRMFSQRMARAFYFGELDIAADTVGDLRAARQQFTTALQELMDAPQNTLDIKQELTLAEQQWLFFRSSIDGHLPKHIANKDIATTSERILEELNLVTAKYEKLSGV